MDDISSRTIVIAVNIFVTIAIVSIILVMFFQMKEIYGMVASTDTAIYNRFNDVYSMYNGKSSTGIGLLNALKKYEDENSKILKVEYTNSTKIRSYLDEYNSARPESDILREVVYLKSLMEQNKTVNGATYRYEDKYDVSVYKGTKEDIVINFIKVNK